jgi:hypothetical protein
MALWAVNRSHLVLRLDVAQDIHAEGWKLLFDLKTDQNCDGEIMAVDARAGAGRNLEQQLSSAGFKGPSAGLDADFVFVAGEHMISHVQPLWLEITPVKFFNQTERSEWIWKLSDSQVYQLYGHRRGVFEKGYSCDWAPLIGKIR